MDIFERSANDLLDVVNNIYGPDVFYFLNEPNYTFTYRRNYTGLMARVKPQYRRYARAKQGYYDILGNMNGQHLTHQQLFNLLLEQTTYEDCFSVWTGVMPQANGMRKHALFCLAMLMFEQEINFGVLIFQRRSHFSQDIHNPNYQRPRDLLMGYIAYMFDQGNTTCLIPHQNGFGLLLPPQEGSYIKVTYFDALRNNQNAVALMARPNIVNPYLQIVANVPDNPNI